MASGIVSWGAYVPFWRLERAAIAAALDIPVGRGTRSVASYDEDTTSLAVEAARVVVRQPGLAEPDTLLFSTSDPAYLDKTNATAVHAALGLGTHVGTFDFVGSPRSGFGALVTAHRCTAAGQTTLVTLADMRTGLPGSADEQDGGDGAAALLFGAAEGVAEIIGTSTATAEFLDRWRVPGNAASGRWEDRFGEHVYLPLGEAAVTDALKAASLATGDLDHVVVAGPHLRSVRRLASWIGPATAPANLLEVIGYAGAAHAGIALCEVLDRAGPGETILVVSLADGADAIVLRTTEDLVAAQRRRAEASLPTVLAQLHSGRDDLSYQRFLTWRSQLHREPPRRPDPSSPAAPPALRAESWKFGFAATQCDGCGTRHLPPARVCVHCASVDQMTSVRVADLQGTVATFTIDRLAFTLSPPVVAAVIDFDGGGRFACELTDLNPDEVHIGLRVEMTFRNLHTANGIRNYFWKAKPVRTGNTTERGV